MLKHNQIHKLIEGGTKALAEKGVSKDGYFMLREPQIFCLAPKYNKFDISADDKIWEKGTQRKQAADIALSTLGCNLPDRRSLSPVGVKATTSPYHDYKMWKQNFKRCYNDLKALKSSDGSKANSCIFTMVHPVLMHKPCVIYAQFGTYEDTLQLIVNARATHLFMLYEDLLRYIHLQLLFSSLLELSLGDLFFVSNNFHILKDQRRYLSHYTKLRPTSHTFLAPSPLTLKEYDTDRRHIHSGSYSKVTWDVFRNLIDQKLNRT